MIRRIPFACFAALGFVLMSGCVYHPPANKMDRYTKSIVGHNLSEVTAQFGPEDHQGGSSTHPNLGTPQNPRYSHQWTRYGSTQHQRFVQTGTESTGRTLVGVLPAGGGQAETPIYQENTAPTGYYTQSGEICIMTLFTNAQNTIVSSDLSGGYCDKLFLSGDR